MISYLEKIKKAALEIVKAHQKELVDVKLRKEFSTNIISVIIDDPLTFSMDIDEVGKINLALLDVVNDDIPDGYYLEVTTPGIERELITENDYKRAIGAYIYLKTYQQQKDIDNLKEITGTLLRYNDDEVEIEMQIKQRKKIVTVKRKEIAKIRLAVDFRRY